MNAKPQTDQCSRYAPYDQKPFAGDWGTGCSLCIRQRDRVIICHRSLSTYLFLFLGFVVFGPMLVAMYFYDFGNFQAQYHKIPWFLKLVLFFFLGAGEFFLARMLMRFPRLLIDLNRKRISFCSSWFHQTPDFVLEMAEMSALKGVQRTYYSNNRAYPNYQLTLETRSGHRIQLCISNTQSQVESLARQISESFGITAQLTWEEDPDSFYLKVQRMKDASKPKE
jgi:hypothetical protein